MTTALVVIDVQKAMFGDPAFKLHDGEGTVARIAGLIARAREHGAPIFFVQHDGGPSSPFRPGKEGFAFHDAVAPRDGDDVTIKHRSASASDRTALGWPPSRRG